MFAKIFGMYNNYWDDGEMPDPSEEIQLAAVKQQPDVLILLNERHIYDY